MLTLASVCEGAKEGCFLKRVEMDKGGENFTYMYVVIQWSIFSQLVEVTGEYVNGDNDEPAKIGHIFTKYSFFKND